MHKILMKRLNLVVLIIFALVLSSLACNFSFRQPTSSEFEQEIPLQGDNNPEIFGGELSQDPGFQVVPSLQITEGELADLMQKEINQRIGTQISDLQVSLRSGQIQILGDLATQGISAPVKVGIDVDIDPVGRPSLNIISSSIGPFPVPGDLIAEVEVLINEAFKEKVHSLAPNLHIENIVIENGIMAIYGRTN